MAAEQGHAMNHFVQFIIAVDQLINALFLGWADETLSARAWRKRYEWPVVYRLINALFFWQDNHCQNAYNSERESRHLPPEYRDF